VGVPSRRIVNPLDIDRFDRIILPGVGNFGEFSRQLRFLGFQEPLTSFVRNQRGNLLGICVGAQILFEASEESPSEEGLGIISGKVLKVPGDQTAPVPRIGWDRLALVAPSPLTAEVAENLNRYFFAHSYFMNPTDSASVIAVSASNPLVPAIVSVAGVTALQFHPERSSNYGKQILLNFAKRAPDAT